jgi:hypothetical protein
MFGLMGTAFSAIKAVQIKKNKDHLEHLKI